LAKRTNKKISPFPYSSREILNVFKKHGEKGMSLTEVAQLLGVGADQRRDLRQALRDLLEDRQLVKVDRRHYLLPPQKNKIVGRVQAHRDGYGFLIPEDSRFPDIFLSKKEIHGLMHRDRVALQVSPKTKRTKHRPKVLEVLERAQQRIVGRYEEGRHDDWVTPEDLRLSQVIRIPKQASGGARTHKIVLAEITRYPTDREGPQGKILKILGDPGDPGLDTEIVIHKYDLPESFPPAVLNEAAAVSFRLPENEVLTRRDLRGMNFFTVDGETARDFDDAVAISREAKGSWKIWVSIADVSHYVKEASNLDKEAFRRGTSVYFPERAIPMLPPHLSSGICSLNPEEERLTMTAAMEVNRLGAITKAEFFPSVIRSQARLTYTAVREMLLQENRDLKARYPQVYQDLRAMAELCRSLRSQRKERGSIDFDLPEPQVVLDVQGNIEEIIRAERHIGHQIIEEFMIAANESVAQFLTQEGWLALHRVHELPDEKKMVEFKEFAAHLGYSLATRGKLRPKIFQRLLDQVQGKPEEKSIHYLLLRSMKQARYSEKNLGHFALATAHYLHFTSPIRRYPDLVVHRILKEALKSGKKTDKRRRYWETRLPAVAEHTTQRERVAMEAEREIVDRKKVQFMRDKIGREYNGYITGVVPFGIFVELEDYFVEGLVHLTRLPEDEYQFLETRHTLLGKHRKKAFRLGDRVKVRVVEANLERRQVDFSLVQ
jgi:ribonuclease R